MKQISKLCYASIVALMAVGFTSCKDPVPDADQTSTPSVSVIKSTEGDEKFKSTSAVFSIQSNMIEKVAYRVVEGATDAKPDAEIIYADFKQPIDITTAKQDLTIYGFEGGETYTVQFAFKIKGEKKYIAESVQVTTPDYTQMITVVELGQNFFRIHFKLPRQDMYYKWVVSERSKLERLKDQFGANDLDVINGGLVAQGDTTIYVKDGFVLKEYEDGGIMEMQCKPGMSMFAMIGECDKDGVMDYVLPDQGSDVMQSVGSSSRPNVNEYTEEFNGKPFKYTGIYARQYFYTMPPIALDGEFQIKARITERQSIFEIVPPSTVKRYGALVVPQKEWDNNFVKYTGVEGAYELLLREMVHYSEPTLINFNQPLEAGQDYKLIVIGMGDDEGLTQLHYTYDFKPIVSDKPAAEVELKAVEAPDKNPFKMYYNVKATAGSPVTSIRYLMNDVGQWNSMLNMGLTYEIMLDQFAQQVDQFNAPEIIEAVNSAEGYSFIFNVWENTTTRMVIQTFNEDDKAKVFIADGTSLREQPKDRVESSLFDDLLGRWRVIIKYKANVAGDETIYESRFNTTIASGPASADPTFFDPGNKRYPILFDEYEYQGRQLGKDDPRAYAKEQIEKYYKEYVETVDVFAKKYRGQNRLVLNDFRVNTHPGFTYSSSWDLFCTPSYSASSTEDLFVDYGPKMFIEIGKDESGQDIAWVPTNPSTIPPFQGHSRNEPITLIGSAVDNVDDSFGDNFAVKVVSQDSIVISHKGMTDPRYLMSFFTNQMSLYTRITFVVADIELKRIASASAPSSVGAYTGYAVPTGKPKYQPKRTAFRLSSIPNVKFKEVEGRVWSLEESLKNSPTTKSVKAR